MAELLDHGPVANTCLTRQSRSEVEEPSVALRGRVEMNVEFWFLNSNGGREGPVSEEKIANLISDGVVGRDSLVWTSGMAEWRSAASVETLFPLFPPLAPYSQPLTHGEAKTYLRTGAMTKQGKALLGIVGVALAAGILILLITNPFMHFNLANGTSVDDPLTAKAWAASGLFNALYWVRCATCPNDLRGNGDRGIPWDEKF